jgi:transposase
MEVTRSGHVVIGVDTHKHIHVAAVMGSVGGVLATLTIATDTGGFRQLVDWASSFGRIIAFGIEGAGFYGGGPHVLPPPPGAQGHRSESA